MLTRLTATTSVVITDMNRTNPTFKQTKLSEDEANAFLDEMFAGLVDDDFIDSNTDEVPDLSFLNKLQYETF